MAESQLEEYAKRSNEFLDKSPNMGEENVKHRIVLPLVELLGWDRFTEIEPEYNVQLGSTSKHVDYALTISEHPEILIEVKASGKSLNSDTLKQLVGYMRGAGVDWGLLTNGSELHILQLEQNAQSENDHILTKLSMEDISDEWDILDIFSRDAISSGRSYEIAEELDERKQSIDKLESKRNELVQELTQYLVDQSGEILAQEIEAESAQFIDDLIENLASDPSNDDVPNTPEEVLSAVGLTLPGRTEEVRQERAGVVLSVYQYLQQEEIATRVDIGKHLLNSFPNEFENDESEFDRHWVNYIRDSLSELPRIEKPARGAEQRWRYIPPELDQEIMVDEIDSWILELDDIPVGHEQSIRRQQSIIQQAYDHLQEVGKADQDEIEQVLPPYTAHYKTFQGFWSYCLRDAFVAAEDIDKPTSSHQLWYYVDESDNLPSKLELEIDDWILKKDIPGSGFTLKERQSIVQYSYNFLTETGEAERSDFEKYLGNTVPNHTGRYNTFDGLWTYILRDVLKDAPNVETVAANQKSPTTYKYMR